MVSVRSARIFLILSGAAYLDDGVFGIFIGWGYIDFGIFTNPSLGASLSPLRNAANLPYIALGAVALIAGVVSARRA